MSDQITELYAASLRELATEGISIRNKLTTAKTSVKKKYYQKKLKTNSEVAARLLIKLERLTSVAKTKEILNESHGKRPAIESQLA